MSLLIDILLTNFFCPNVQTTVGGGGGSDPILSVQTFCVHTSLGGGEGSRNFATCPKFRSFFFEGSPQAKMIVFSHMTKISYDQIHIWVLDTTYINSRARFWGGLIILFSPPDVLVNIKWRRPTKNIYTTNYLDLQVYKWVIISQVYRKINLSQVLG